MSHHIIHTLVSISLGAATKAIVLGFLGYVAVSSLGILKTLFRPQFSPLRALKGPPGGAWLRGHFPDIREHEETDGSGAWYRKMLKEYGHVWVHKSTFNVSASLSEGRLPSLLTTLRISPARPVGDHRPQGVALCLE